MKVALITATDKVQINLFENALIRSFPNDPESVQQTVDFFRRAKRHYVTYHQDNPERLLHFSTCREGSQSIQFVENQIARLQWVSSHRIDGADRPQCLFDVGFIGSRRLLEVGSSSDPRLNELMFQYGIANQDRLLDLLIRSSTMDLTPFLLLSSGS
ncbi:MAG: hypothetical protein ACK53T_21565 [Planctomycetota bacterium]